MESIYILAATAFWIGILTAISPCPLATNIAAISFVSYRVITRCIVLASGALYTLGRSTAYVVLSFVIVNTAVNAPMLADFLQRYINKALGILLILVGMLLLDMFKLNLSSFVPSEKMQQRFSRAGVAGSFGLGVLFALAFCPISTALFFGSLIPMAVQAKSSFGLPLIYGIGTALPVLGFAIAVAFGVTYLNRLYQGVGKLEYWAKRITGVVLIGVGVYYTLVYIFGVL